MRLRRIFLCLLAILTITIPSWARVDKKLTEHRMYFNLTWLSQNKILYATDQDGQYDIWLMNADGSANVRLTNDSYIEGFVTKFCPFSDGSKIVYVRKYPDKDAICVMNADGSGLTQVVSGSGGYIDWSSTNKIVYNSWNGEIWTVNSDGTGKTLITTDLSKQTYGLTYSPNGTKIAYQNNDGIWWVMNSDGSNKIGIGKDTIIGLPISFSPNGNKIVYTNMANVFTKNVDGTGNIQLTTNEGNDPRWSPNGEKILYEK